jgi:hypothetical protein
MPIELTTATNETKSAIRNEIGAHKAPLTVEDIPLLDATAHAADQIDRRIAGLTASDVTKKIFTTENHAAGIYVRNPQCWAADIDLTGLGVVRNSGGGWTTQLGFAAITPRHVVMCHHAIIPDGSTLRFVTAGNVVADRTLSSSVQIGSTDLRVGTLSADLPGTITPLYLAPPTASFHLRRAGLPIFVTDQDNKALVAEMTGDASLGAPGGSSRSSFYELAATGDSGRSWAAVHEGRLVALSHSNSSTAGPDYASQHSSILTACGAYAPGLPDLRGVDWEALTNRPAFSNAATITASASPSVGQIPLVGSGGKLSPEMLPDGAVASPSIPLAKTLWELTAGTNTLAASGPAAAFSDILAPAAVLPYDDVITVGSVNLLGGVHLVSDGTAWVDAVDFTTPTDPAVSGGDAILATLLVDATVTFSQPVYQPLDASGDWWALDRPLQPITSAVAGSTRANLGLTAWATKGYPPDSSGVLTNNGSGGLSWEPAPNVTDELPRLTNVFEVGADLGIVAFPPLVGSVDLSNLFVTPPEDGDVLYYDGFSETLFGTYTSLTYVASAGQWSLGDYDIGNGGLEPVYENPGFEPGQLLSYYSVVDREISTTRYFGPTTAAPTAVALDYPLYPSSSGVAATTLRNLVANLPTSATGLSAGNVWRDGNLIKIV